MMDEARFVMEGEPRGKGRPRFNTKTGRVYTPVETENYENWLRFEYARQCGNARFSDEACVGLEIWAYFGVAKSDGKKKREAKLSDGIRPRKKPDMDNIVKSVADSLNGVAYKDDAQIVECSVHKHFSENPRVEVRIYQLGLEREGQA